MNIQQYASILSRFNRVPAVETTPQNVVVVHWSETKWEASLVGRLRHFDKIVYHGTDPRPLVRALGAFYRTDCVVTTFLSRRKDRSRQQTVLMGNERILTPVEKDGRVFLCVFPFFVKDPDATLRLKGGEGVYPYRDGVLFADACQVPFPGGSYYDRENTPNEHGRLCFLTRHRDAVPEVYADWYGRRGVLFFPFQTRVAALRLASDFFDSPKPVSNVCFPSTHLKSSGTVRKRLSQHDPHLLLQDVLNTYGSANASQTNALDNVALFVEYPFVSGFENNCGGRGGCVVGDLYSSDGAASCSFDAAPRNPPRYVPFLVNGLNPKTVIQVKHPYDRYVEYQKMDTGRVLKSDWTVFLYERYHRELLPSDVDLVRVGDTVLGYRYRDAFFCLSYPMLADSLRSDDGEHYESLRDVDEEDDGKGAEACERGRKIRNSSNYNTQCLLNAVETFDPKRDPRLVVFGTYGYDDAYDVYQVKHAEIRNELWCLVDRDRVENPESCRAGSKRVASSAAREDAADSPSRPGEPKYFRKAAAPLTQFVYAWIDFFYKNVDKKDVVYGNMDVFRLAMVLARHKICLALNLSRSRSVRLQTAEQRSVQLRGREYVFDLDRAAVDFINDMRLSTATEQVEDDEKRCVIL